jgi:hypothetical protein
MAKFNELKRLKCVFYCRELFFLPNDIENIEHFFSSTDQKFKLNSNCKKYNFTLFKKSDKRFLVMTELINFLTLMIFIYSNFKD